MADKYNYLRLVGKGSFGKAWLVESKSSHRQYVVKEIQVSGMADKDRNQAVNEVAILARLKHKNVVRYREAFVMAGSLNIVMAYAAGGDLGQQIQQAKSSNTSFPEHQVMGWFVQIMFALTYIHQLKILHRDLKPQNIFLTKNDIIKIGDFGIARALKDSQDRANTAIGTPYYLSPEICRRQPYNHKSDMWAAGCVLYELLMLHHPFEADDFSLLVLKILRGKYQKISSDYGPLPGDLVSVLLRVNPDRRPSAEQVISIQTMQCYVKEYTGRPSSRHSMRPAETSPSTADTIGSKVTNDIDKEGENVFLSSEDSAPANTRPAISKSDESGKTQSGTGTVMTSKEPAGSDKRKECDTSNVAKVRSCNVKDHNPSHDDRCKKAHYLIKRSNRYPRRIHSDSSMSQNRCDSKKKIPTTSDKENDAASDVSNKHGEPRVFCKEGITTVKRRKYSCLTPVAPKVVSHLGTPQSVKVKNLKHIIGQECDGTPPALRLFGKHLQGKGIALRDGWSPDVSPMFKTRVLRKELPQEGISVVKDKEHKDHRPKESPVVSRILQPSYSSKVAKSVKEDCEQSTPEVGVTITSEQLNNKASNIIESSSGDKLNVQRAPRPVRNELSDSSCRIQREINEILLACSPFASENRTDIQTKLELLKQYLERKLGNRTAVLAYNIIANGTTEKKQADEIMDEVERFLNPDKVVYAPLLIHIKCLEEWSFSQVL